LRANQEKPLRYISTRGEAPPASFTDVLLAGLARDGGLYVPETWPRLSTQTIAGFKGKSYQDVAFAVMQPFLGAEIAGAELKRMIDEAYEGFGHREVAPLVELSSGQWLLELFHGPTLAFKDFAMQFVARLMDFVLATRKERVTIVVATSGDTGGAAVEAFRGRERVDLIVLFPKGRVSDVQRRMMTTATEENVHALAIEGTFDDCQTIVKHLFNDHAFRDRLKLSAVNSINFARIVAQSVYYFTAAVALGAPARAPTFVVPTGNFGDIFAGYAAKCMGLPIARLVIATNENDILARALKTGRYEPRAVVATSSPAMDIQISSNFERLLFYANGCDGAVIRSLMRSLAETGSFTIAHAALEKIREIFDAERADDNETRLAIRDVYAKFGYLLDPHGAVGFVGAQKHAAKDRAPIVILGAAHPAKFPEAVEAATGIHPALPPRLADLNARKERVNVLPADRDEVARFIAERSRVAKSGAIA
jgi:threonine synthase